MKTAGTPTSVLSARWALTRPLSVAEREELAGRAILNAHALLTVVPTDSSDL